MNLAPLFEAQRKLDEKIVKEKGLEGQYLLDKKILALQVELAELANEWRVFKFWSENQEPNAGQTCPNCEGACHYLAYAGTSAEQEKNCDVCNGDGEINPLLEEYVDCLHFILSIGNDIEIKLTEQLPGVFVNYTTLDSFEITFFYIAKFSERRTSLLYKNILIIFTHLGNLLGFTWEQIEQAYFSKNKINHDRQANGY